MLHNLSDLDLDLSRSLRFKCDSIIALHIYAFLLMFNGNTWANFAHLRCIEMYRGFKILVISSLTFQGHSRSNVIVFIGLLIYVFFLLMSKSNMLPNSAPVQDIRLRNQSDFEFHISRSIKAKCDDVIWTRHTWFPIDTVYIE